MTNNKKIEKILSITFDLAEVMQEWYKCECDCGKSTYFANKATKFFQNKLTLLFKEIEEMIKEKRKETWKFYHEAQLWEEQKQAVRPYDEMLKALKTIKERWV